MPKGVKGFQKGHEGSKPVGAVHKTTKLIKEVFAEAFYALQDDPKVNLIAWAKDNPNEFYKLGIRLVPTQVQLNANIAIIDEEVIFE